MPRIYRNQNCRLVYLHLVLRSGWHDHDRDLIDISIRNLAYAAGLTVSATRHALHMLETEGLIKRQGTLWAIKKWIIEDEPTPRARTRTHQKQLEIAAERRRVQDENERARELEKIQRQKEFEEGKTSFMQWYEYMAKKAAAGDAEAQKTCERNRKAYEDQQRMMAARAKQK